jgi:hypothetical protein
MSKPLVNSKKFMAKTKPKKRKKEAMLSAFLLLTLIETRCRNLGGRGQNPKEGQVGYWRFIQRLNPPLNKGGGVT